MRSPPRPRLSSPPGSFRGPAILVSILLCCGCATRLAQQHPDLLPQRNDLRIEQLVFHSDIKLPAEHRLLRELTLLRTDVSETLAMPTSDEPVHVYLFEDPQTFHTFVRRELADYPERRAFFVKTDTRLAIFARWGDRVAEDLRHEVAHGYLHSVVPNIPLWLDEGLAEYFEVPRGTAGLNRPHLADLTARMARGWRPHLERLEQLTDIGQMSQVEYAESWAWVHFLLESHETNRQLLQSHLAELQAAGTAPPLSLKLRGQSTQPAELLLEHLRTLATTAP